MNKQLVIASSILASVLLTPVSAIAEDPQIQTDKQKFSYGIGLQIGQGLKNQKLDIDQRALELAIRDALAGSEPRISIEELRAVMAKEEQKMTTAKDVTAKKNLEVGKAFLAENAKLDGVKTTDSGLQYRVIKAGTGPSPKLTDTVTVHYKGTLIDGTEFDSSYSRNQPATFPLKGVVKGWQEALPMMKEGGKWEIFVPSTIAYGDKGAGGAIGPNETLIFEIELLNIQK
jgi:FKBP-type peptidyl-prolyl cis-trans isomerase FklB